MVTSFLHHFARFSQGIRAHVAQWLERAGNNRKVAGSNLGSAPSPFLFAWGPSIGPRKVLGWGARAGGRVKAWRVARDQHDSVHWQCEVLG